MTGSDLGSRDGDQWLRQIREALTAPDELAALYQQSASFHAHVDLLSIWLAAMVKGIAEEDERSEEKARVLRREMSQSYLPFLGIPRSSDLPVKPFGAVE